MDSQDHNFIIGLQKEWNCPISHAAMEDPVITADGHTYERNAIAQWFQDSDKSPKTNLPLSNKTLIPNHAFKNLTQKLYNQLPVFLERQESLRTEVDQLKQQIQFLKNQLEHEKQKIQELDQKEERLFKTKKIEKSRQEHKNQQINIMREQKNRLQKQIQSLRSIEQQQARQIKSLKQELHSFSQRYTEAAANQRKYKDQSFKIDLNRSKILSKLQSSFASNFTFIAHLLNSIEQAKKFESERRKSRPSSQQTLEQNGSMNDILFGNRSKGIIDHLQQIIKDTVNKAQKQDRQGVNRFFSTFGRPNALTMRALGHQPNNIFNQRPRGVDISRPSIFGPSTGYNPFRRGPPVNSDSSSNIFIRAANERNNTISAQIIVPQIGNQPRANIFARRTDSYQIGSTPTNIFSLSQQSNNVTNGNVYGQSPQGQPRNIFGNPQNLTQSISRNNIFGQRQSDSSIQSSRVGGRPARESSVIESRRQYWGNVMRTNSITEEIQLQSQPQTQQNSEIPSNPINTESSQIPQNSHEMEQQQQQQNVQSESVPQNQQQINQSSQNNQSQQIQPLILPQQQNHIQEQEQDSSLYKQLLTIKWMMSKRKYKQIPEFYNYRVCRNNDQPETYWFGVHVSVLESHIPFNEFLSHSWNHVRWLDLSACGVDDALWRQFIESSHNFKSLMFINANRNEIETVKKQDLEKFRCLVKFSILRNKLNTDTSVPQIRKYIEEHPNVKVDFSDEQERQRIRNIFANEQ